MIELMSAPWPWYVAGPLFGLFVPLLLLAGGKAFGISGSYRPICAVALPTRAAFFQYDWRSQDGWNLIFALGIVLGGAFAGTVLAPADPVIAIAESTRTDIAALGITDFSGYVPRELVAWYNLLTVPGFLMLVGGGVLVGFGARYAGGCTSGHAVTGLADLQPASLVAVLGFFVGGMVSVHLLHPVLVPWLLS